MPRYGTLALADLMARQDVSIQNYGQQRVVDAIKVALDGQNAAVFEMIGDIGMELTTKRIEPYGDSGTVRGRMHRVNEYGAVDVQKVNTTVSTDNLGYPLDRWQYALGFTLDYIETRTPRDAAIQIDGAIVADMDRISYQVQTAYFNPVSDLNYRDYEVDNLQIPIRRLLNGDGAAIPSYRGKTFNPNTHTHYLARAGGSLADADITAAFAHVIEHGLASAPELWINVADEGTVSALPSFVEFDPAEWIVPVLAAGTAIPRSGQQIIDTVDPEDPDNRAIGRWKAKYIVRTKPWVPANYCIVVDKGKKPLRWRTRAVGDPFPTAANPQTMTNPGGEAASATGDFPTRSTLRMLGEHQHFPLAAEWMGREYGIGVGERSGAAILYFGGTSYVMPTITMPAV